MESQRKVPGQRVAGQGVAGSVVEGREVFNLATLVDLAAQRWGDRVALEHADTGASVTYRETAVMMNRVGNALRSLGVDMEDRVALLLDDCPQWVYAFFGALKIGAIVVPMNTLQAEKDYAFFLGDSRARVLFVGASYLGLVQDIISSLPYLRQVVVCGGGDVRDLGERAVSWENFVSDAFEGLAAEPTLTTDTAFFAYTSGSTGRPRAIMRCHSDMVKNRGSSALRGYKEGDVQFHTAKLYFSTSFGGLVGAFDKGTSFVLLSGRPTGPVVLDVIARYRPTFLAGAPTMFARMVDAAKSAPHLGDLSSVRYIFSTGEPLPKELFEEFKETFGKSLFNCWGAQELAAVPLAWRCGDEVPPDKVGSVGRVATEGDIVKLIDESGNEVPDGAPGQILVKVAGSDFLGYWHEPQETTRRFVEGWYKPGDFFLRDQDGYFWYQGRADDIVKVGGRQVFPAEVEQVVGRHPAVVEAAVVPVPNEHGLIELHAFVVLKEGHEPSFEMAAQIQSFVKGELAPFKRPARVKFIPELPRTGTGKIQRFRLREQAGS